MSFPRLYLVRQNFPDRRLADVPASTRQALANSGFAARLKPAARVAIGVGSRGIANLAAIVRAAVDYWKDAGMRPFLFPAMGSHGAATAEGQAAVLAHYGITEASMGCPVVSQLDVVPLGATADGIETFLDRAAFESDGVMLMARVKWHTDFDAPIESGLFKMMAIGLGKFAGAQRYHAYAYRLGLEHVIRSVGRQVLASCKILGGVAILEDAWHNTARIDAVPVEEMEPREERNLALVKSWMPRLPAGLDILVLDEIGKNISGSGMDTKIVNRGVQGQYNPWPDTPRVERIFVRNLSELTHGNAIGFGMADMVTDRLVAGVERESTWINALTSTPLACVRTPIHYATDRECLERLAPTVGKVDLAAVTYGWMRNTMEVGRLALSENLKPLIGRHPLLEVLEGPCEMPFGADGNLVSWF